MTATTTAPLQIGQRVSCSLPHAGMGTIVAIDGEQSPETCQSAGRGLVVAGGGATFGIVWDNGGEARQIPEALLRQSVQWAVHDEVLDAEAVEAAKRLAKQTRAAQEMQKAAANSAFEQAKAALATDPALAGLKRADQCDDGGAKLVAANLRKLLKTAFPKVKFSVRKDSYTAVNVSWTDGPTKAEVDEIAQRFKRGSFNSTEDIYESSRSPWCALFGGVDYVFTHRDYSEAHTRRAIDALWAKYPGNLKGLDKPTPEGIRQGAHNVEVPGIYEYLPTLVRSEAAALAGDA